MRFVCGLFLVLCAYSGASDKGVTPTPAAVDKFFSNTTPHSVPDSNKPDESFMPALDAYLFKRGGDSFYYDPSIRPGPFGKLNVVARFQLLGLTKVDASKSVIGVAGILFLNWEDNRLTWNETEFGGIDVAVFDGFKIWMPQFMHNGEKLIDRQNQAVTAMITSFGTVISTISINEEVPCHFDMTDFPEDTQTCYMQFYYLDLPMVFMLGKSGMVGGDFHAGLEKSFPQHPAWDILNVSLSVFLFNSTSNEVLIASITMKRRPVFFVKVYVVQICFLLLLTPVIFLLPPESSEKLIYGAVLLFSMMYVSHNVDSLFPTYTESTPYLIKLPTLTTASGGLLFLCLLLSAVISSVEKGSQRRQLPAWMKRCVVGVIGRCLLVKGSTDELARGAVHINLDGVSDRDRIVPNELGDISDEHNEGVDTSERPSLTNGSQALQALVDELRQSRLQRATHDDWSKLFIIVNRILFLLSLVISITIISCFV